MQKTDFYLLFLVIGCYAIFSFHQLGSTVFPTTTWQPVQSPQTVIFELEEESSIDRISFLYAEGDNNSNLETWQLGIEDINLFGSDDAENWEFIGSPEKKGIFKYAHLSGVWNYRYLRLDILNQNDTITEIGFKAYGEDRYLPVRIHYDQAENSAYPATLMIDEQEKLALHATYMDEAYFDEVYHPRNAVEIANGQYMYPSVHPLFGTTVMAISIKLFGSSPFSWRLPGVLEGMAILYVFYRMCLTLFRKRIYAVFGIGLLATEFMHYTTSRIATLEPMSVLLIMVMYAYMMQYFLTNSYDTPLSKRLLLLLKCGIAFGFAGATKWTAFYSAVGLAILFFVHFGNQIRLYLLAGKQLHGPSETFTSNEKTFLEQFTASFKKEWTITIALCFVFFIFLPVIIHFICYIPTKIWRDGWSVANVIGQIKYIYKYHVNLEASHPYESVWYQWLLDIRPIWYYYGTDSNQVLHSISCFTNPVTTWIGFVTTIYTLMNTVLRRNRRAFMISIGYLSALLPWVLVTRCVFAYHFYPTSIFMLLSIVFFASDLKKISLCSRAFIIITLAFSTISFLYFLPVISGFGTNSGYIKATEWLNSWYFG